MRCFIPLILIFSPSFGQFPPRYEGLRPRARHGSSIPIMTHREPIMTGFCPSFTITIIIVVINCGCWCVNRNCMLTMLWLIWCVMMDKATRSGPIPNSDMGDWYCLLQNISRLKEWSWGWQWGYQDEEEVVLPIFSSSCNRPSSRGPNPKHYII